MRLNKQFLRQQAGAKLREIRKENALSIFKAGKAIGVSGSFISQIERGVRAPSDAVLISLAALYQVPTQSLFDLYNRLENTSLDTLLSHPALRKTFTQITTDKSLSPDELSLISQELQRVADKYLTRKDEPDV